MTEEPKSIRGNDFKGEDLSGALLPWSKGTPIYVQSSSTDRYYLPCFTEIDDLRAFLMLARVFDYEVKRIGVGSEFLTSFVGSNITVILNPIQTPESQLQTVEFHLPVVDSKLFQC